MSSCAWCGHYCFDGEYTFDSITSLDQDYIDAASTAFGLVFCCESCRQAWKNDFNDKWHQKEALKEEEENRRREYERQEYERREDEQSRCEHTLRCDQCGRELPAVRGYDGWNYPMHLNLAGKKTSTFYSESDYRLEDISPDEFGCYCSNQCYEAAKASGLVAKAIAEAAKQTQCFDCNRNYYIGTGVLLKKEFPKSLCRIQVLNSPDYYYYHYCSADCARAACTNNCHFCGNTYNPLNLWTYSYYDEDGSKQYTAGYCSQACAKEQLKEDIAFYKRTRDKDALKRLNSATIECFNVNDYIVPEQPIENTGSTSAAPAAPAPAAAKPAPAPVQPTPAAQLQSEPPAPAKQESRIEDANPLKLAIQNAKDGDKLPIQPGTYHIDFAIDKGIIIEGKDGERNIIFEFDGSFAIHASAVFRGVKFICKVEIASESNLIHIRSTAKPQFTNCSFEKCGITVYNHARPTFEGCDISGAYNGIAVTDFASVDCRDTTVHDARREGISIELNGQNPDAQPALKNVKVSSCGRIGVYISGQYANPELSSVTSHGNKDCGFYISYDSKGTYRDCETYENGTFGFQIDDKADPVLEQCKAYNGMKAGFYIHDGGKGTYRGCEAYGTKGAGFFVARKADPVLEQCKAHDGAGGFAIREGSKGTYRGCEAYENKGTGFHVDSKAAPVLEQCKAHDGKASGFVIKEGSKGTYRGCEAYGNQKNGFLIKESAAPVLEQCKAHGNELGFNVEDGCACTFTDCKSDTNSFSKTTGGTGFKL